MPRSVEPWLHSHARRRRAKHALWLSIALTALLYVIPLGGFVAYPLMLFSTLVHELMPADYYSADAHILGARVDQLAFAAVLQTQLPALARHLDAHHCPISLI
ncbi:MAG: hypothetical protein KUG77_02480, partial [Nannocystaceae bacterium]|nr:hypothetical protein [Nannocystaceae bacterium]